MKTKPKLRNLINSFKRFTHSPYLLTGLLLFLFFDIAIILGSQLASTYFNISSHSLKLSHFILTTGLHYLVIFIGLFSLVICIKFIKLKRNKIGYFLMSLGLLLLIVYYLFIPQFSHMEKATLTLNTPYNYKNYSVTAKEISIRNFPHTNVISDVNVRLLFSRFNGDTSETFLTLLHPVLYQSDQLFLDSKNLTRSQIGIRIHTTPLWILPLLGSFMVLLGLFYQSMLMLFRFLLLKRAFLKP